MVDADLLILYDTEEAGSEKSKKIELGDFKLLTSKGDIYNRSIEEPSKIVDAADGADPVFIGNLSGNTTGTHTGNVTGDIYNNSGEPVKIVDSDLEANPVFIGNLQGGVTGQVTGGVTGSWRMNSLTLTTDTNLTDGDFSGDSQNIILDGSSNSVLVTNWRPTVGKIYFISCIDNSNTVSVQLDNFFNPGYFRGNSGGGGDTGQFNSGYGFMVVFRPNDDFIMVIEANDVAFN